MKKYPIFACVFALMFNSLSVDAVARDEKDALQPLSKDEAMMIVQAQEEDRKAKEAAAVSTLLADPEIVHTTVHTTVDHSGQQTSVYNRLPARVNTRRSINEAAHTEKTKTFTSSLLATFANQKPLRTLTLSGQVDADGISEIWWIEGDRRYRVFTNANFFHLTTVGRFEDDDYRYQNFLVVTPRAEDSPSLPQSPQSSTVPPPSAQADPIAEGTASLAFPPSVDALDSETAEPAITHAIAPATVAPATDTPWRPTLADFTPGAVEYYLVEPSLEVETLSETTSAAAAHLDETESTQSADPSPSDSEAGLAGLEAILRYYAEHTEALRIAYHNRLQITAARQEYLAQNPPEEGDKIINFRPLLASEKKSLSSTVSGQDRSFTVTNNPADHTLQLEWNGVDSMYYFIEKCDHLDNPNWHIAPFALKSIGQVEGTALQSNTKQMFFRLIETDDQNDDNMLLDSDFDGISNGDELSYGLNAFGGFIDHNGDDVLDEWSDVLYEGNLPPDANFDGDLLPDRAEFLIGGNPANFDEQADGNLDYIYRDDLLAYWNFDDHQDDLVLDLSGNGHHFTLGYRNYIRTHRQESYLRNQIEFKPSNPVQNTVKTFATPEFVDDFTLSFWARAYPYDSHVLSFQFYQDLDKQIIIPGVLEVPRFFQRILFYNKVANCFCLKYTHEEGDTSTRTKHEELAKIETLKGDRQWHHYAFSFRPAADGAGAKEGSLSMYLDGKLVHEEGSIDPVRFTAPELSFEYQGMDLDDIRLFKRGLSSAEVAQLRNGLQHIAARTDTEAPETPSNGEWKTSAAGARANWSAVTDNENLNGYIVERDNRPTYFTKEPRLIDTVSGNHSYAVRAFDKAFNVSPPLELGTLNNNQPPSGRIHLNLQGIDVPFHRMLVQKRQLAQIDTSGFTDDGDIFDVELQENGSETVGARVIYGSSAVDVAINSTGVRTYDMVFTDDFGATTRSNEVTIEFIDTPNVVYEDSDYPGISLLLSAETTAGDTPSVRLHWPEDEHPANLFISRKNPNETEWQFLGMLTGNSTEYTDTTVATNRRYDYRVQRVYANTFLPGKLHPIRLASGYVRASIEAPLVEHRGEVLLLVDETVEPALRSEIDRFKQDLIGDGWRAVVEHTVPRHVDAYTSTTDNSPDPRYKEGVQTVKTIIEEAYETRRGRIEAVILLGRVPIPLSGHGAADMHLRTHWGAWPADVYYGDVVQVEGDGEWTDLAHRDDKKPTNSNNNSPHPHNRNLPGDGKFDNQLTPSMVELAVGRIDLAEMSQLGKTEVELLRNYLNKNHAFRQGNLTAREKGLIDIDAVYPHRSEKKIFLHNDLAANAFNNFSALFGHENVEASNKDGADFFGSSVANLGGQSYLFGYGAGAGHINRADQLFNGRTAATPARCRSNSTSSPNAYTCDFADYDPQVVFTALYGSYFGDWMLQNSLLRAPLGGETYGLACLWGYTGSGQDGWFFHGLGAGESLGEGLLLSQNNRSTYLSFGANPKGKHHPGDTVIALMGDPTLRVFVCPPPTGLSATVEYDAVTLSWAASPADQRLGYHLYRKIDGTYQRLNEDLIAGTSYRDADLAAGTHAYQVRAVERRTTGSGSFLNASQGAFVEATVE